jgi:hypothetical protein
MNEKEFNRDEYISECYATPAHNVRRPHKHAELIKAWANGAVIQQYKPHLDEWHDTSPYPVWDERVEYRIKPESKPDYYTKHIAYKARIYSEGDIHPPTMPNLKLCFDGETGELKSAEVLK